MADIPNPSTSIKVIFEDGEIAVIEKPAGIPVYPLKNDEKNTISKWALAKWPESEPVHRLDNDTSGLILIAKNKFAFKKLRGQFENNTIHKEYIALVLGETPAEGVIETPIIHDPRNQKKMRICQSKEFQGSNVSKFQKAHTEYKLIKRYSGGRYSLLQVKITTGVRHQIRLHLASVGYPIAGDKLYQTTRQAKRDGTNLERQFLHASMLSFIHPTSGKNLTFRSELTQELQNVLTKL